MKNTDGAFAPPIGKEAEPVEEQFPSDDNGPDGYNVKRTTADCWRKSLKDQLESAKPDPFRAATIRARFDEADTINNENVNQRRGRQRQRRADRLEDVQRKADIARDELAKAEKEKALKIAVVDEINAEFEENKRRNMEEAQKTKSVKRQAKDTEQNKDEPVPHPATRAAIQKIMKSSGLIPARRPSSVSSGGSQKINYGHSSASGVNPGPTKRSKVLKEWDTKTEDQKNKKDEKQMASSKIVLSDHPRWNADRESEHGYIDATNANADSRNPSTKSRGSNKGNGNHKGSKSAADRATRESEQMRAFRNARQPRRIIPFVPGEANFDRKVALSRTL